MEELWCQEVAMCVCLGVWRLQCIGVTISGSCGAGELQFGQDAVWGELWCVAVIVCGSYIVR